MLSKIISEYLSKPSETDLEETLLKSIQFGLKEDEIVAADAGFKLKALFDARLNRLLLRLAKNFTARRNFLLKDNGGRLPEYGDHVRPLERSYNGNLIAATVLDRTEVFQKNGVDIRVEY